MSSEALKPCPFCGGSASLHTQQGARWIRCQTCGAETADAVQNEGVAAFAWNRRTPSPSVLALVEACKSLVPTLRSGDWGNQDETADEIEEAISAVEKEIQP